MNEKERNLAFWTIRGSILNAITGTDVQVLVEYGREKEIANAIIEGIIEDSGAREEMLRLLNEEKALQVESL